LVSQSTAALLPDAGLEKIGEAEIKGLTAPVGIHTLAPNLLVPRPKS